MSEKKTTNLNELLSLERPVCFIDIESTGVNVENDRIVEITIAKVQLDGTIEVKTKRFNPEVEIPKEATAIHGITNADVANEPTFKKLAKGMLAFISGCDLGGYASNRFDIPLLNAEFIRAGVTFDYQGVNFYDVCNIFMRNEGRTLKDAYRFYCGKDHVDAHHSEADVLATIEVFEQQLGRYENLPKEPSKLNLYCNYDAPRVDIGGKFSLDAEGDIIFNFGKSSGKKAKNDKGLLQWMVDKATFSPDVVTIANNLLNAEN